MSPRSLALLMVLLSWTLATASATVLWGWEVGALVLAGLIWVDIYLGDRLRGDA